MEKARKEKGKKNVQSIPLVATQNTNLFSQLSAQYLQNKSVVSEEEKKFIDNTQVIEYHDPEINRILQRLRKKDQITKVKAILQLKEHIFKMQQEDIDNFASTFCYLFRSLVLNEESKKIHAELNLIVQYFLKEFKRLFLPNISILFPALLIFQKVNRCNLISLLFTGDENAQLSKALVLLEKQEVSKQFLIVSRIIIDKHDKDKLGQSLLQNNCSGLIKSFIQFIYLKEKQPEKSQQWNSLFQQFKQIIVSPGANEFLKENSKAKAALLEIYVVYLETNIEGNLSKVDEKMLKDVLKSFLQKDQVIQYSLWKYCNVKLLKVLSKLNRNKQIEDLQSKLLDVLQVGGEQMFKSLKQFIEWLPGFKLDLLDATKFLNTLALIKKLNQTLLNLQEYNEQRIQCYDEINSYFLSIYHSVKSKLLEAREEKDHKKWEECKKAVQKAERSIVQNLEQLYYKHPPASKNSFSYYIPPVFTNLIRKIQILPRLNINTPLTYNLYTEVASEDKFKPMVDEIFASRKNLDELIEYFQKFPSRAIEIEMTSNDISEAYKKCRIYQLTIQHQTPAWFTWSTYFNFFMFDSMLEVKHISMIDEKQPIVFNKKLNISKMDKYIPEKFKYFQKLLSEYSSELKYYIPSYTRYIIANQFNVSSLLAISQESKQKLKVPNTNIINTVLSIYSILVDYLKSSKNHIDTTIGDLYGFVLYLYDYNMENQAYGLLQKVKELKDTPYFETVLQGIRAQISKRVLSYVDSGEIVEEKKERLLKKKVDKFIVLLAKTLQMLVFINQKTQILILAGSLLSSQYFKYALYRPEIWILLHSVASQLSQNQIQTLVSDLIVSQNNQIIGLLICANSLYPLQTNIQLKRFYQGIYSTYVSPRVIDLFEKEDEKGYSIVSDMLKLCQKSLIYSVGIKNIIKQSIIEELPSTSISKLFSLTIDQLFNVDETNPSMRQSVTLQTILPQFSKYLNQHINIFDQSLTKVESLLTNPSSIILFQIYLDVITIFWQQKVNTNLIFEIDLEAIIKYLFSSIGKQYININFQLQCLLNFMNVVIQNKTLEPFSDYLLDIQKHVGQLTEHNKEKSPEFMNNALVKLCEFLRKILPIIEAFSSEFTVGLFNRILQLCLFKVKEFEKVAQDIDAGVVDENIDNIVLEFSELINRFTLIPSIKGKEEDIIELLTTRFPALQKSAFIYLKHIYETKLADKNTALYLMKKVLSSQATDDIATVFSQTLLWVLLFIRKMSLSQTDQLQEFVLLFEKQECSSTYLNFLFKTIEHLGYDQTEEEFYCDVTEVSDVGLDWSNYMSERELFKLLIQSLFIFTSNFPMDLRLWYDKQKDKKQQSLCQKILKNIISDALFNKQIQNIELRQEEWKTEEFNVYVLKKSKQISAEYSNNGAKISLKLKIKDDYPLNPIVIEFGNELKIEQKLNKWILKLKSLLYNQNNSICSGIILWKQNIDKQFEGLEECAICYDIVNNQKQLPKMVCKTCKKKFHSACIRKWFQTSNKSECPLCKSQFL